MNKDYIITYLVLRNNQPIYNTYRRKDYELLKKIDEDKGDNCNGNNAEKRMIIIVIINNFNRHINLVH